MVLRGMDLDGSLGEHVHTKDASSGWHVSNPGFPDDHPGIPCERVWL